MDISAGTWGLYPWFEEHGTALIHPDDLDALRRLQPYGLVFECTGRSSEYIVLRYAEQSFRVGSDLFRVVRPPERTFGDEVRLRKAGAIVTGRISDILWQFKAEEPFYFVTVEGKRLKKRY